MSCDPAPCVSVDGWRSVSGSVGGGWAGISGGGGVSGQQVLQGPLLWLRQRAGSGTERTRKARRFCINIAGLSGNTHTRHQHSTLFEPPDGSHMMRNLSVSQDWRPGSRCRAVFSEDGLVYPAVVLWVKGQHCRVRYDDYNNEEEHNVDHLLSPDELHGPSRTATNKVNKSSVRV